MFYLFLDYVGCRSVVKGLLFDCSGVYVNLSQYNPDLLCVVDTRIALVDTKKTAACILVGFAGSSNLANPVESVNPRSSETIRIRQIVVAPFAQFFR